MYEKRYQIFISSTFKDLEEERRAVQDTIISMGDFPVQMESFPAADENQMDFIRPLIEQSDYYVLIIGGRYGSIDDDGLSFTHKEFRHAIDKGVPVIVLLHANPDNIVVAKSEATEIGKQKLKEFIAEAEHKRIRKTWETVGDLKLAVREALDHAKRTRPRTGWVPGDSIASFDALEELNEVRKENEKFRDKLSNLAVDIPLPKLPAVGELTTVTVFPVVLTSRFGERRKGSSARIQGSWISFFPLFHSHLDYMSNDWNGMQYFNIKHDESCVAIGSALAGQLALIETSNLFKISRSTLNRLTSYYTEAGLMLAGNDGPEPFTELAHQIARRHHVLENETLFTIVEGEVSVSSIFEAEQEDRIPF